MTDVIMAGYAGLAGSLQILTENREELKNRFSTYFLEKAEKEAKETIEITKATRLVAGSEVSEDVICMVSAGQDGVFGALWELGERLGKGLSVELKSVPIRQETVELANFADVNPYKDDSDGVFLLAVKENEKILKFFQKRGIPTAVIGSIIDRNKRVVVAGERETFLLPPARE